MAVDDPLGALDQQFANEERSKDPVLSRLATLAALLPLPLQADKLLQFVIGRLGEDRYEKIELMLKAIRDELQRHEKQLRKIAEGTEQEKKPRFEQWLALALDGLSKAERTRAHERVERIGKIVANSLVASDLPSADAVEEMMRVAMDLSDVDVQLLNELVRIEGELLDQTGRAPRYQAWESWPRGNWGSTPNGDVESVFNKLESFGLVSRLAPPNNLNILADYQNRYSLLRKGLEFIKFVRG